MDSRAPNVDELLRIAREDISRNSLSSAEKTLEQAILMNHTQPDAFHLLGYVYSKRGKFKKAILAFQKTLNLDPFYTDAAIALSSLLNDVGKYKEGAAVFFKTKKRLDETAPGHDPRINENLSRRHYELGLLYMRFERFREAHHEFSKAYHLQPSNINAAVQMAKCLARSGEKQNAIEFLRKTIESHPDHVDAKLQLGVLYHSLQKLRDAKRLWEEALAQEPENKSAQMYLSMLEYEPSVARL